MQWRHGPDRRDDVMTSSYGQTRWRDDVIERTDANAQWRTSRSRTLTSRWERWRHKRSVSKSTPQQNTVTHQTWSAPIGWLREFGSHVKTELRWIRTLSRSAVGSRTIFWVTKTKSVNCRVFYLNYKIAHILFTPIKSTSFSTIFISLFKFVVSIVQVHHSC